MKRLQQVEEEYKEYAYIVSHDLNAPLRHIREFSKLLVNARDTEPDDNEKQYIHFLNSALDKIELMQKALLTFSRINTSFENKKEVNINDVVRQVTNDCQDIIEKNNALITIKGTASIHADYNLMHLMFSHLIDNALSFKKENIPPQINIIITSKQNNAVIEIEDNGIGFDNAATDKIFKLFYKANPNSTEKIGAGLAFIKKIIQLHNGSIEAFGTPEKGSTFSITLPGN